MSWQPPNSTQDNGAITLYSVTYVAVTSLDSEGQPLSNVTFNTSLASGNLTNLIPNTTYSVSVSAWTSVGQGPMSPPFMFHTDSPTSEFAIQMW